MPRPPSRETAKFLSRRALVERTLQAGATASLLAFYPHPLFGAAITETAEATPHPESPANVERQRPDDADLEIAALGAAFKTADPEKAKQLAAAARQAANLPTEQAMDWCKADLARRALTAPERVNRELQNSEAVFVEGWLLSHSEAGAALLYAEAQAAVQP